MRLFLDRVWSSFWYSLLAVIVSFVRNCLLRSTLHNLSFRHIYDVPVDLWPILFKKLWKLYTPFTVKSINRLHNLFIKHLRNKERLSLNIVDKRCCFLLLTCIFCKTFRCRHISLLTQSVVLFVITCYARTAMKPNEVHWWIDDRSYLKTFKTIGGFY